MTRGIIQFVLDGEIKEINFNDQPYSPTTTLLNYLRSISGHKGVKEGCAEGDCGACTVVIAELVNNKLVYKAYDSCLIFLPQVHGKQVITIENLSDGEKLHIVQKAMVDHDGSQCGYCTPGFVMALFALYKNAKNPDRNEVTDALSGNLCRCTGYRPIVDAAMNACTGKKDHFSASENSIINHLIHIRDGKNSRLITTDEQQYFLPLSLHEACEIKNNNPGAVIINGSTDVALRVTKKREIIEKIIDLSFIDELKFSEVRGDGIVLGSGLCLEDVRSLVRDLHPSLYEMLSVFGSKQIRNKATIGGNVGTASPIGDTPPVLMALGASVILKGTNKERTLKVEDFIKGYRKTALKEDELIKAVFIPFAQDGTIVKSYKVSKRKDLDISTVSAAFRILIDHQKKVSELALFYGGMAASTKRAAIVEEALIGKKWTRESVENAIQLISKDFSPISDARSGKEARLLVAGNLLLKFWSETTVQKS